MNRKKTILALAAVVALGLALTGCTETPSATQNDQVASNSQLDRYQKNQPIPAADWSQYRQTVIDVENAQIHGVATTTFFFNQGTPKPIKVCPSIGFAVPTTAQLTNPDQITNTSGAAAGYGVVAQQEPSGVYTGASSGTYVVCVASDGSKYISYWEGDVQTEGGAAHWDNTQGLILLDGAPTVTAKTQ
ncbi:hypothetical protein [Cryobacterium sp. GrIS_2_6]|uniref:hypothetical protein n=1 Tax=Cryobacterium sp. GrIS_2_6 TaxID=3162785 RepID=UPI002E02E3BC|nr:hypothetical protein [Cryobacterium psychrotolerans]MEC5149280.1 hypothetical protein [Cryobacterium psychrotolerans]MEC5149359.1 hypothetical protein [Cryobacterium psychrotolerans]